MDIVLYPSYIFFKNPSPAEEMWLDKKFSVREEGYFFMKKMIEKKMKAKYGPNFDTSKMRQWDGFTRFYNQNKKTLPIGFLPMIKKDFNIGKIDDLRPGPITFDSNFVQKMELRHYQKDAIAQALFHGNGVVDMAPNAGKTLIFVTLSMILRKNRVLILTDRAAILDTIVDKFPEYTTFNNLGRITAAEERPSEEITVAMIQTLSNRLDTLKWWLTGVNVILIDECHHVKAKQYTDLLKVSRARMRLGFSGTIPEVGSVDHFKMTQFLGDTIAKIDSRTLIDAGISVEPHIRVVQLQGKPVKSYRESISRNVIFSMEKVDALVRVIEKHKNEKVLVVSDIIKQGQIISRVLSRMKINNQFLYSDTAARDKVLSKFKKVPSTVLISTHLIDEGVDIPDITVVVLAFPRKSYRQVLQRIGRGLRTGKGKTGVTIYDFLDMQDRYMKRQYYVRAKHYAMEQFKSTMISSDEFAEMGSAGVRGSKKMDRMSIIAEELLEEIPDRVEQK